ncbi:anoctamin-1-like isoform X2 [Varroa jacobsoni]|uniref:Anoctamin n=1 Tax=Varroa destructor TaxID=109461 RepID=A0A7M7J3P4_VARDE|nr:anoctamin-1-like isoform X2 [Varroa destructor]XP_022703756.1 anoctamin-1-like isoform X2 [Varroa jacobsoni]
MKIQTQLDSSTTGINMFEVELDETVAKGPLEDILHETLTAEYVPQSQRKRPKRLKQPGVCYMSDGYSKVDFVLAYDPTSKIGQKKRDIYEQELIRAGLKLDYAQSSLSRGGLMFIKISAPWEVLSTYAEVMRFKMPVKESCLRRQEWEAIIENISQSPKQIGENEENEKALAASRLSLQPRPTKKMMHKQFAVTFSKTREYLFDIPEVKEEFFTSAQRSQIVNYVLQRKTFSRTQGDDTYDFGINRLLADLTYLAAYPVHEGSNTENDNSLRNRLLSEWASIFSTFQNQPLDDIRRYFGIKVGLYFAWLGFYTYMLIPASFVGILCFAYGIMTVKTNAPTLDVCINDKNIVMCPSCDDGCEYWQLKENCKHSMMTYLFDNAATVCFSIFMALWSAAFLELWKRYSSRITYQWDLSGFDTLEENSRPEYVAKMTALKKKLLDDGGYSDRFKPQFWRRKLPYTIFSVSVILLAVLLCISAAIGVILYRMTLRAALALKGGDDVYTPVIVSSTAAFLNLMCIIGFNMLYSRLAVKLTDMEMPRTQSEYDDSLTLKMYLLQFVNCYSSIFYIALFKGKFVGRPGKYNYVLGSYQQEVCGTGGCFQELSIQLAVIMIGKQAFSAIYEFFWPAFMRMLQKKGIRKRTIYIDINLDEDAAQQKMTADGADVDDERPWERDYCLPEMGQTGLFFEYLEIILQYGFVTLFVAAFPVAPLFALINNIFEIRLDAKKLLNQFRRPVGQRVKDIGVWYRILDVLGKLAVLSNAVIIAFTSELIPRLYYMLKYNPNHDLFGYVNFTLSTFDTNHYGPNVKHKKKSELLGNSTFCRYSDYRTPPWDDNRTYKRTIVFWEIFVWRLLFVIIFENVIVILTTLIRWLIPDIPRSIREKIREDNRLTNELIILQELKRRQQEKTLHRTLSG